MNRNGKRPIAWLEKTITTFAPEFRKSGPLAHGSALISPTRSASGADVYKAMREVRRGDLILHLVNNEDMRGISFAAEVFRTVQVGASEFLSVPLYDYHALSPPLSRWVLFDQPYRQMLEDLLKDGLKATFFTRDLKFAQGAYLTPVPSSLMAVIDMAYKSVSGKTISDLANIQGPV